MHHPLKDVGHEVDGDAMAPDAQAFLDAVLEHEMSLRSRVRCIVAGSARSVRRATSLRARARARRRAKQLGLA